MEFNGQYLKYEEYKALGGTLDLTPFNLLEFETRRKIDIRTQNRLVGQVIPQEVKLCEYAMINSISNYSNTTSDIGNKGNVASESIDGYSVNYVTSTQISEIVKSKNAELEDIIKNYLIGVIVNDEHIMYVGV